MKKIFPVLIVLLLLSSCKSRVVSPDRPMQNNSLELYHRYEVQTNDARVLKMKVVKVDQENIYGKLKSGEIVTIPRSDIHLVRKTDVLGSILLGLIAVGTVIIIPI